MIIATRSLILHDRKGDREIPVRIHAPERSGSMWNCRFDIEWPGGNVERWRAGTDAVQSLLIALQIIGAEIYASRYHQ